MFNIFLKKCYFCFKIACEFAKEMLKTMLEEYDKQLMDKRDKQLYRNKGLKPTTVKTLIGEVDYKRRMYINKENNKSIYLMDQKFGIKGIEIISDGIINLVIDISP